jgi:hypothetical protein
MSPSTHAAARAAISDARPPRALLAVVSPPMRLLLRTPLGRSIGGLALLSFDGRRSGRRYRVVAGWHHGPGGPVVVTPAGWRHNFAGGHAATIHHRGRRFDAIGRLDGDAADVAEVINHVLASGTSARALALRVPAGRRLHPDDVRGLGRAAIRFAVRA